MFTYFLENTKKIKKKRAKIPFLLKVYILLKFLYIFFSKLIIIIINFEIKLICNIDLINKLLAINLLAKTFLLPKRNNRNLLKKKER